MKKYFFKRLLLSLIVMFGVVVITFAMTRVMPGDAARKWAGPKATEEQIAAARIELGLDKPVYVQFGNYLLDLAHGDLGESLTTHRPVLEELISTFPATLELALYAIVIAIVFGLFLGIYSARYKNKLLDHFMRVFSIGAVSFPTFWVALVLQLVFFGKLGLFPLGGRVGTTTAVLVQLPHITGMLSIDCILTGQFDLFLEALKHIVLPAVTLSLYPMGTVARFTRSSFLEVLGEDYITAEKSYGIKERFILWIYAMKNSLGGTITVVALSMGDLLTKTFLVEAIFSWPGVGRYISESIMSMDYPAIMGVTLMCAMIYVILNMIADLLIALDPRVRA